MKNGLQKELLIKVSRVVAIITAAGLAFMAAGNLQQMTAWDSFQLGAKGVALIIAIALLSVWGVKGRLPREDFDAIMLTAAQQIQTKQDEQPIQEEEVK